MAIANDTDIAHAYTLTFINANGTSTGTASVTVPARSSVAKFLDEITPATANTLTQVQIRATDFSYFSVMGLRFTGTAFTTIPAF